MSIINLSKTIFLLIAFAVLCACSKKDDLSNELNNLPEDQKKLMAQQAPWPITPDLEDTKIGPVELTVYVSKNCLLCEQWKNNWPKDVNAKWVEEDCHDNSVCKKTPRIETSDGEEITGWPDEQWLKNKTGRPYFQPPETEAPIINI